MGQYGAVYLNFGLWALSLAPAWLVIKEIGMSLGDRKVEREKGLDRVDDPTSIDEIGEILPTEVLAKAH